MATIILYFIPRLPFHDFFSMHCFVFLCYITQFTSYFEIIMRITSKPLSMFWVTLLFGSVFLLSVFLSSSKHQTFLRFHFHSCMIINCDYKIVQLYKSLSHSFIKYLHQSFSVRTTGIVKPLDSVAVRRTEIPDILKGPTNIIPE